MKIHTLLAAGVSSVCMLGAFLVAETAQQVLCFAVCCAIIYLALAAADYAGARTERGRAAEQQERVIYYVADVRGNGAQRHVTREQLVSLLEDRTNNVPAVRRVR